MHVRSMIFAVLALGFAAHASFAKETCPQQFAALTDNPALVAESEKIPPLPTNDEEKKAYTEFLQRRYGFDPKQVRWTENNLPVIFHGYDNVPFDPAILKQTPVVDKEVYDSIVIGGGPSGLTSSAVLSNAGKKVLLIEREQQLGGLAAGGIANHTQYGRGAAYIAEVDGKVNEIYKFLGVGDYTKRFAIKEPIDSFYWNGKLYKGLWEKETLKELPPSFRVFKYMLKLADRKHLIAEVPIDEFANERYLDSMTAAQWINKMPELLRKAAKTDPEAKKLLRLLRTDSRILPADPMKDVIGLIQLYGRSALGDHPDLVNAQAFANFYISELDASRFTSNLGTGLVTDGALKVIGRAKIPVNAQTGATFVQAKNVENGVEILYVQDGTLKKAIAKTAIYGAPMRTAQTGIVDFEKTAPEAYNFVKGLQYRDYDVVNVHTKGQPWTTTYDLWVRDDKTYTQNSITDIIDGRWMDFRNGASRAGDDKGVLTVYRPKPQAAAGKILTEGQSLLEAQDSVKQMNEIINPLVTQQGGEPVQVLAVEVNRWPSSIHIVEPGHFQKAKVLQQPVGNIYFSSNDMGVPAIEEGLFRGYDAGQKVLKQLEEEAASGALTH